jgi:hypothetical protein
MWATRQPRARLVTFSAFLVALAATTLLLAPTTDAFKPFQCPPRCLSCEKMRGHIPGYPGSGRLILAAGDKNAAAGGGGDDDDTADPGTPQTAPIRIVCKQCDANMVPSKPYGTSCGASWAAGAGWLGDAVRVTDQGEQRSAEKSRARRAAAVPAALAAGSADLLTHPTDLTPPHRADCEAGTAMDAVTGLCTPCTGNTYATQGKPGRKTCKACLTGMTSADKSKCFGTSKDFPPACETRECGMLETQQGALVGMPGSSRRRRRRSSSSSSSDQPLRAAVV